MDDAKFESTEEDEEKEEEPHTPVLRRSVREIRQLERYIPPNFHYNFSLSMTDDDPKTIKEAMNS